jgi:hypothetical protein
MARPHITSRCARARRSCISLAAARRSCIALAAALVLLAGTTPARATPDFPDVVAAHLSLRAPPDCTLCHAGTPARGTVTTPFGTTLRSRGAQAYDAQALERALDALAAERKDSDGDGVPDIDELRDGDDPNSGVGGPAVTPEYGCAVDGKLGRSGASDAPLAIIAAILVALAARRARRKASAHVVV